MTAPRNNNNKDQPGHNNNNNNKSRHRSSSRRRHFHHEDQIFQVAIDWETDQVVTLAAAVAPFTTLNLTTNEDPSHLHCNSNSNNLVEVVISEALPTFQQEGTTGRRCRRVWIAAHRLETAPLRCIIINIMHILATIPDQRQRWIILLDTRFDNPIINPLYYHQHRRHRHHLTGWGCRKKHLLSHFHNIPLTAAWQTHRRFRFQKSATTTNALGQLVMLTEEFDVAVQMDEAVSRQVRAG